MRYAALLVCMAIGGCSSGNSAGADMSAAASCTLSFGGDISLTTPCRPFIGFVAGDNYSDLDLAGPVDNPTGAHAVFDVDGMFAQRSYASADFRTIDVGVTVGGKDYRAGPHWGSGALTMSVVMPPSADGSQNGAHGNAQASLVEVDTTDAGQLALGPGRATLSATF